MQEHWRYSNKTKFHNTKDGTSMQTKDGLEVETNDKRESYKNGEFVKGTRIILEQESPKYTRIKNTRRLRHIDMMLTWRTCYPLSPKGN
jgi:lysyl-tRNA synthetase class I